MLSLVQNNPATMPASPPPIIGAAVINPYSEKRGYIVAIENKAPGAFMIGGGGLQPIRAHYLVAYADSLVSVPDTQAAEWIEAAAAYELRPCPDIHAARAAAESAMDSRRSSYQAAEAEGRARREAFKAVAAERVPAWAQAVIYAELLQDDSDSMSDYWNAKTVRTVIIGFSSHKRDLFPELRKAAAGFAETADLATAPADAEHREKYSMGGGYYLKAGTRYSTGWRIKKRAFYGDRMPETAEWIQDIQPPAAPIVATPAAPGIGHNRPPAAFAVEKHHHTKGGFDMWVCVAADRVDRDEFDRQRDAAKAAGGWYSRAWGRTPGGFAFKSEALALAFVASEGGGDVAAGDVAAPVMAAPRQPAAPAPAIGDRLRDLAAGMESAIADKFRDRLSNTPKRQREAASARNDGRHLQRAQKGLLALAAAHDAGSVPAVLASVRTKAAALDLAREAFDYGGGYYDAGVGKGKPRDETPAALAFWALAEGGGPDPAAVRAEALKRKIDALQFASIPGYFPTPAAIVARMIDAAGIDDDSRVLEPSAGSGNIADAIRERFPAAALTLIERHNSLASILCDKGHEVTRGDFMEESPGESVFDAVIMNPPFEAGQDMAHVQHAFGFLKPGGRLVAIMSPGPFFRSDRKSAEFRAWFEAAGGWREDLPAGAFKESGTGVATVLCVIERESR